MKKIFFLFLVIFFRLNSSSAQEPKNLKDYIFKAGDVLEYEVNKQGKTYRLIITLTDKTFIDSKIIDAITYNWETTEDTIRKGTITITKEARVNADTYQTEFTNGTVTLKNKSCLWLSLVGFHTLLSPDGTRMDLGSGTKSLYKVQDGGDKYAISFKGKPGYFSSFRTRVTSSGNQFTFCPTTNSNALILSFDIGWTMKLKEVR